MSFALDISDAATDFLREGADPVSRYLRKLLRTKGRGLAIAWASGAIQRFGCPERLAVPAATVAVELILAKEELLDYRDAKRGRSKRVQVRRSGGSQRARVRGSTEAAYWKQYARQVKSRR